MPFSRRFVIFLFFILSGTVAVNFFALRHFSEKYFAEYVATVKRDLPDINLELVGAVIAAKNLDETTMQEYRDILRDLSNISSGLERFSKNPKSFLPSGSGARVPDASKDFLSDPIARSFALSSEMPVLSKILSFRAFGANTPEGAYASKVLASMFYTNLLLIAVALASSSAFIRWSFKPLKPVVRRIQNMAARRDYAVVDYRSKDEFSPLIAAINDLSHHLELQEKIRSDFLSDFSHEIKTPISAIKCYLEGIEDGVIPLDEKNVRRLSAEIDRLIRIADSVMRIERLEGKRTEEIRAERVDVTEAVASVAEEYAPMLSSKGQKVEFPSEKRFFVRFDRDGLSQIVHNAFSNFHRYAGEGATLSVRFRHSRDASVLTFADNGAGVPAREVPFLREKFYQAEKSRTNAPGRGTGIGLSIIEKIVRLHGGTLEIRSDEGVGFEMEIRVPKIPGTAE